MTKFICAAILAVGVVTYSASPAEACGGVAARARTALKRAVCVVREPLRPRALYVVPAFVAPVPKSIPQPMPKVATVTRQTTVTRSVSPCPGGVCPSAPVRSFLRRQ